MTKIITKSSEETRAWACEYAQNLHGGEIIGLIGDLGAGKTTFSQGIAEGLGVRQNVNSPTYVIMKIYRVEKKDSKIKNLVHIDAYRLESENDIENIGALEYFNRKDTVVLIEWADKIKNMLTKKTIFIKIKHSISNREFSLSC